MKIRITGSLLLASLSCTGCVSMGTNYNPTLVSQLQSGMTKEQVVAMLGTPNTVLRLGDGSQNLVWTHSTGSIAGATARSLTLLFDANGKYVRVLSEVQTNLK